MTINDEAVNNFLEHYGVKGMKWGIRKERTTPSRKERRAMNKASRAKDRERYAKEVARVDRQIDKARKRTESKALFSDKGSKSHTEWKEAKAKYKQDKKMIGSREAKKALESARLKRVIDIQYSNSVKSGKETTDAIITSLGGSLVSIALASTRK